jgi:hypothetical protein
MTMDGRNRALRPRTRMAEGPVSQPQGWSGIDQMAQRTLDPVRTFEVPFVYFPADILVPASTTINIPLPPRCAQIAFINVVPNVVASLNSGGARTIKDGFVYNGEFTSLQVATDAAGSCTIQLACY